MTTIAVAGCSYSDRTRVPKSYGDYLAEMLGYQYLHLARGCSGNNRAFYKIASNIVSGNLTAGDIVIQQYTDTARNMLGSYPLTEQNTLHPERDFEWDSTLPGQVEVHNTPWGEAYSSDFKVHSWQWQEVNGNDKLHRAYEDYGCIDDNLNNHKFITSIHMIQALCEKHNVIYVPFVCRLTLEQFYKKEAHQKYFPADCLDNIFSEIGIVRRGKGQDTDLGDQHQSEGWDSAHLSTKGHMLIASLLADHIQQKILKEK